MKNKIEKCTALARISLPWAGRILNYCPIHANQLVILANGMGSPIKPQMLSLSCIMECESNMPLTKDEKKLLETFKI